jgi:hypothetical protein
MATTKHDRHQPESESVCTLTNRANALGTIEFVR